MTDTTINDVPYPDVYCKRVIYPGPEGRVYIAVPSPECDSIERMIGKVPAGIPYQVVHMSEIPTDRTYRNAWTFEEG